MEIKQTMMKAEYNKQLLYDSIPKYLSYALREARFRGLVAEIWFKFNELTHDTRHTFNALMKEANREFKAMYHQNQE